MLERQLFPPNCIVLARLLESTDHKFKGLFLELQSYSIDLCIYSYATTTLS